MRRQWPNFPKVHLHKAISSGTGTRHTTPRATPTFSIPPSLAPMVQDNPCRCQETRVVVFLTSLDTNHGTRTHWATRCHRRLFRRLRGILFLPLVIKLISSAHLGGHLRCLGLHVIRSPTSLSQRRLTTLLRQSSIHCVRLVWEEAKYFWG